MTYLLLVHIGPVQDMIATARRSRDLWFGSWLLSELAKAAARAIAESQPTGTNSLIFPAPQDMAELQHPPFTVANRILAIVEDAPKTVAEEYIRPAIWERLSQLAQGAFQRIGGHFNREVAEAQVKELPEFFWVAVSMAAESDYPAARQQVETLMAARKATHNFAAVPWGAAAVPKSSLDGVRESVIYDPTSKEKDPASRTRRQYRDYRARRGEQLSGVDLLKRWGQAGEADAFPSTSHMAAMPFLRALKKASQPVQEHWDDYYGLLKSLAGGALRDERIPEGFSEHPVLKRADGSLLFSSRLRELFADDKEKKELNETEAVAALQTFLKAAAGGREPYPYYALLQGDGDRMGEVIDAQKTPADHRRFSAALAAFAAQVNGIVMSHDGALVYAGGDDVLAFLPLDTALACAQAIRAAFDEKMGHFQTSDNKPPTFSAGLVVAHHIEPLSDTLDLVRQTEKAAKAVKGKNALAVTVAMRGGVPRTVAGKWETMGKRLHQLITWHQTEQIPDGAAYQLRDTARRLGVERVSEETLREAEGRPECERDELEDCRTRLQAAQKESIHILGRKRAKRGAQAVAEDIQVKLNQWVGTPNLSIGQLADELIIARTFARAKESAA